MPSDELWKLWKLHQVDQALLEIRKRAAALDPGKQLHAEIKTLEKGLDESEARKLAAEQKDLELQQKGAEERAAKLEKELYGGKVVNPREVETMQKEIDSLKRQRSQIEERILEIWEALPPAKEQAAKIEVALEKRKKLLAEHQKQVMQDKSQLERDYKEYSEKRPQLAKAVGPALLSRYEAIRANHGGIGMAEIVKERSCGGCGTLLPERVIQQAKDNKVVTCEACHRILILHGAHE
jgi:uncharacterized protein